MTIQEFNFTNDQLNGSFELVFTHNKNTQNIVLFWFDENSVERTQTDTFQVLSDTSFKIMTGGPVTGKQTVRMAFNDSQVTGGKRLFVDYNTNPNFLDPNFDTSIYKVAYGNAISTYDETLENFITKCKANAPVDALISTNNLSDLANKSTARFNLGVENIGENNMKFYNFFINEQPITVYSVSPSTLFKYKDRFSGVFQPDGVTPSRGKLELSFVLDCRSTYLQAGQWYDLATLPTYYEPYETKYFEVISTDGKAALCRQLGKTYVRTDTNPAEVTTVLLNKRNLQIYFVSAPTGIYFIDYTFTFNEYY